MQLYCHGRQVRGTRHCISHHVLVTRHVHDVPVDAGQRLYPTRLLVIQALLGLQVSQWIMVRVDIHGVAIFQIATPLACSKNNGAQLFFKSGMVDLRGIHFSAYPCNGMQSCFMVLHQDSSIGIITGICVYMEGLVEIGMAQACGIDQSMFDVIECSSALFSPCALAFGFHALEEWGSKGGKFWNKSAKIASKTQE